MPRLSRWHNVTIDRRIPLFSVNPKELAIPQAIFAALEEVDVYICPHLRSSCLKIGDRKEWTESDIPVDKFPECRYLVFECSPGQAFRQGRRTTWSKCPNEHCFTCYGLRYLPDGGEKYSVILEVGCDMVGGPTHPSWQALLLSGRENGGQEMGCKAPGRKCEGQCCLYTFDNFVEGFS